jgi:hypothetical protein
MAKETEEGLILKAQGQKALNHMLEDMMIFINAMKSNENLKKMNAGLIEQFELIAEQSSEIKAKVNQGVNINLQDLSKLTNDLNRAQNQLRTYKFEDKKTKMLKTLGRPVFPNAKKFDEMPEQKQMDQMQEGIKHTMDRIQKNAEILVTNAVPKHRSLWERFTRACVNFAKTCKDKFLSVFGKKKQESSQVKPQSFQDKHLEEVKKDPVKRQYTMAAAAAAAKGKRREESMAQKTEAVQKPVPEKSKPPQRPPRKL